MILKLRRSEAGFIPANTQTKELFENAEDGAVLTFDVMSGLGDRSAAQNRLKWKWLTEIGNARGHTPREIYDRCKPKYIKPILIRDNPEIAAIFGSIQGVGGERGIELEEQFTDMFISSRLLNTKQFSEMLEHIERDARMRGIDLTRPEDLYSQAIINQ